MYKPPEHPKPPKPDDPTLLLLDQATGIVPFTSDRGQAFVGLPISRYGYQVFPIRSGRFRDWLINRFYAAHELPPNDAALRRVLRLFEARAHSGPVCRPVAQRTLSAVLQTGDPGVVLQLANLEGEVVEIGAGGWKVECQTSHAFHHSRGVASLPAPVRPALPNDAIARLRALLSLESDSDWTRCLAWLVSALNPAGPYPILVLDGPSGAGKSVAASMLRSLVDPSTAPLLAMPRSENVLLGIALHAWAPAFDHVSAVTTPIAAALCRLSTGGGWLVRERRDDHEPLRLNFQRPILIVAAPEASRAWLSRPDLADRVLLARCAPISPQCRRTEQDLWREFEDARPLVLGALCDAVSAALARLPEISLASTPRLADPAAWCAAAAPALGLTEERILAAFASPPPPDPVAAALARFMSGRPSWTGTAAALLDALQPPPGAPWPQSPKGLTQKLRRAAGLDGLVVEFSRANKERRISVTHRVETCDTDAA